MMDTLSNHMRSTNEYNNPIHHHDTVGHVDHHTGGYGYHHGIGGHVGRHTAATTSTEPKDINSMAMWSGSSSSSSSKDDGLGGRTMTNKGINDKTNEKLPRGHKDDQSSQKHYGQGVAAGEQTHEKKGIMEKIKEKLPGSHGN